MSEELQSRSGLIAHITELEDKLETAEDVRSSLLKADREAQAKIAKLEAALPRAYNEGFSEGMKEDTTGGESMWHFSKTYAALEQGDG